MNFGIKNKVAFITASSKGLGKAIALQLSKEGAKVVISARNKKNLLKTRDEIEAETENVVAAFPADVTNKKQIKNVVEQILKKLGTIDILVCNAGGPPAGMFEDFNLEDYRAALELNLLSTINLCYEVIPFMKKNQWGRIINSTSVSVKQPIDNLILSNTSRTGVIGFSKSLSNQVAEFGITVNAVCPGYTETERVKNLAREFHKNGKGTIADFYKRIESNIPMGRLGTPEEFANVVTFLASESASYITGVALQIDGGFIKCIM